MDISSNRTGTLRVATALQELSSRQQDLGRIPIGLLTSSEGGLARSAQVP